MKQDTHLINPTDLVVALEYSGDGAPRVTAKGKGCFAEQLLALAEEHDIPLHSDPQMVEMLAALPTSAEIPEPLYLAVAEVIAFAWMVAGKFPEGFEPPQPATEDLP